MRHCILFVGLLIAFPASSPAAPAQYNGTLTFFIAGGASSEDFFGTLPSVTGSGTLNYSSSSFTLPIQAFATDLFIPRATSVGGPVPLPTAPNSVYTIGQVINLSSGGSPLSQSGGPGGGFGGHLSSGGNLFPQLGISGLGPIVFGSVLVPMFAGSGGFFNGTGGPPIYNGVTWNVFGSGWTTGTISYDDRAFGTTLSGATLPNPIVSTGTAMGTHRLGPNGGSITLVTPYVIKLGGGPAGLWAGHATLQLQFVPEPLTTPLLIAATALLLRGGGLSRGGRRR